MRHTVSRTLLIGSSAGFVSALALALVALTQGLSPAAPLKATAHVVLGPDAVSGSAAALVIGGVIHVVSACFWAVIAVLLMRPIQRTGRPQLWLTGLVTAMIAAAVDYLLMPARLTPGWELALPIWGIALGFAGLGLGLSLGLLVSRALPPAQTTKPVVRDWEQAAPTAPMPVTAPDRLRRPGLNVIDQRQQRIDPANEVTKDPNCDTGGPASGR
ncbi:hypothetical protein [Paracoccus laeviglucosivorans]|uniref:Uncharacterized protein n=1 Tax=Paracoccus laeviglucosivorans TaxID=1197861 RepID=A0A521ENY9_9RHOB|nr:hypothetical protein [Paracoccus laeviglucosivorans]SMO85602.1 hypothetical protein SAMN06265221_11470 [Paracoccus laeviglucosivorans]